LVRRDRKNPETKKSMYFYNFVGHPSGKARGSLPMSRAIQSQESPSNSWWNTNRSLPEIADHLQRTVEERQALERRLVEVLEENKKLQERYSEANAEHSSQCRRMQSEITNLRLQANEMLTRLQQKTGTGR